MVVTSFPVRWITRKSKEIYLPGFQGIPLYDVVRFFFQQVRKVGIVERSSAISFNLIMAIPPIIIFFCTLIPYIPISKEFTEQLYGLIKALVPGEKNNSAIITFIKGILNKPRNGLLSVGFLLAMFYSSNAMMGIMRAFDKNYIGFKKKTGLQKRKTALQLTFLLFILVMTCLFLLVMQGSVLKWIGIKSALVRAIIKDVRWAFIVLLFLSTVSLIYRHAPFENKKWKFINPGAVLATSLMILFTILFSYWVNNFSNYNKLYGSISAILILMLLIYFNSLVLLIGFELNVSINSLKYEVEERNRQQQLTESQVD